MISRHDEETYFPLSFNEQMSWLGAEIQRIIKTNRKNEVRNSNADGFGYEHLINRMFQIIKEDPKNIALLREVKRAEKEWWAYCAELKAQQEILFPEKEDREG